MDPFYYQGHCPHTGQLQRLPRAPAEAAAHQLMGRLPPFSEGKMLGVLVAEGDRILYAYSGRGPSPDPELDWVPLIESDSPHQQRTLRQLQSLRQQIHSLAGAEELARLAILQEQWQEAQENLQLRHRLARQQRQQQRLLTPADGPELDQQSRADGREWRQFKQAREAQLQPLREAVEHIQEQILLCKRQRRQLSQGLQADLHRRLQIFPGPPWSLAMLFPQGPPTGVGECCAPKLLHYAASQGLRPQALAEFWWGKGPRKQGHFYAACAERCQPLIGPLLASQPDWLRVIYEDRELLVVDKPGGVLSVAGRDSWNQDCLLTRLQSQNPQIRSVHRLDLETSGLLLFAKDRASQAHLQRQFERRQVRKTYHARLEDCPAASHGLVDLALGPDPLRPGCYRPDPTGKAAITHYQVVERSTCRLELCPHTGRSHQLRIHARWGLGSAILGDRLYGSPGARLMLHAQRLEFTHPTLNTIVTLECPPPF